MREKPEEPVWFDTHAHLQSDDFDQDRQAVLQRAQQQCVRQILLPASNYADALRAVEIAEQQPGLCCAVGCHPHEANHFSEQTMAEWLDLVQQKRQAPIVAIGEIGLDYHYDFSPRLVQQRVFRSQLELASTLDLPVIIHEREATEDCLNLLEKAARDGLLRSLPGVFHCFSGSVETGRRVRDLGFYLGFDGPVTFKNARKSLAVIAECPTDCLLLETDSPYLTPVPYRGKRNEPSYLPLIGEKVAVIWQLSVAETAASTTANARWLYGVSRANDPGSHHSTGCYARL
ncbi:MAG: TatD family hydrolase [Ruminococcaceae bacterium]|nr:TatD family hydrolase [Oscillospiraceae bacterium]